MTGGNPSGSSVQCLIWYRRCQDQVLSRPLATQLLENFYRQLRQYSVIILERIALSTMGEQLQMQLCGIITLESILCNCAFNTNIDLQRKLAWCQMHSSGAAVND